MKRLDEAPAKADPAILNRDIVSDLCKRHHGAVFRYVAYRVRNRADAEDLAADVFVRLLGARLNPEENVLGFIFKIAEHLITDYYRRRSTRNKLFETQPGEVSSDWSATHGPDPGARLDIELGLRALSGEQYQVIILRFLEGYSTQEVAEALGKSPGAVKALQFRALQNMRIALLDHETRR